MGKKLYKYYEYFGRMGSLQSVFVATDSEIKSLPGRVYLGEVLGKHSEVSATINDETLRAISDDKKLVALFEEHLDGCVGVNLLSYAEEDEEDEQDDEDEE